VDVGIDAGAVGLAGGLAVLIHVIRASVAKVLTDEEDHHKDGRTLFAPRPTRGFGGTSGENGTGVHVTGNLLGHAGGIRGKCSAVGNEGTSLPFLLAGKFDPPPVAAVGPVCAA